jgi:hypothetical protein
MFDLLDEKPKSQPDDPWTLKHPRIGQAVALAALAFFVWTLLFRL